MSSLIVWVDGVGAVLVVAGDRLTVGGPPRRGAAADLPLTAPLRPVHAQVVRRGEGYAVEAGGGPVRVGSGEVLGPDGEASAPLGDDAAFTLLEAGAGDRGAGDRGVRCEWRRANPLSPTGVLTLPDGCRPPPGWGPVRIEAAALAAGPVIFGPGTDAHVRVRDAAAPLLLRWREADGGGGWEVRSGESLSVSPAAAPPGPPAALGWRPVAVGDAAAAGGVALRFDAPA